MMWKTFTSMAVISLIGSLAAAPAMASIALVAKAKEKGYPAQSCQYCHVSKMPKKDTFKPDDLNDRGKWLSAEKQAKNAKEVDVDWLKSYPGGKEQK
jgi:hypothetical protein